MNEVSKTKKTYNSLAGLWAKSSTDSFFHERQFRIFLSKLQKGDKVIDIGCASGIHVPLFLGIGEKLKYEGYDFSKSMLKIAQSRYPKIKFDYLDISDKKTLPKKKFNAFWASAVLMHVPESKWDDMFSNIQSLVKPESYGYITIPQEKPHIRSNYDQRHFTLKTKDQFIKYLTGKGWKVVKSEPMLGSNKVPWNWYIVKTPKK